MTIAMCITWLILFYFTIVALLRGKIFTATPEETLRDTRLKRPDLEMALAASTQVGIGLVSAVAEEEARESRVRAEAFSASSLPVLTASGSGLATPEMTCKEKP